MVLLEDFLVYPTFYLHIILHTYRRRNMFHYLVFPNNAHYLYVVHRNFQKLGNIHNYAMNYLPDYAGFAQGETWTPKAGFLYFVSGIGLIGFFIFLWLNINILRLKKNHPITFLLMHITTFSFILLLLRFNEMYFFFAGLTLHSYYYYKLNPHFIKL